ncbi:MAG: helix-turn-helix domain-containing protein [Hyphomicrobiaceae bacterium]
MESTVDTAAAPNRPLTMIDALLRRVAADHGLTPTILIGRSRIRKIVKARYDFIRLAHAHGYNSSTIGWRINRDHTTVLYALDVLASKRPKV